MKIKVRATETRENYSPDSEEDFLVFEARCPFCHRRVWVGENISDLCEHVMESGEIFVFGGEKKSLKIAVKNEELDQPYCYEQLDEQGNWLGVAEEYDPERVIPGWIIFDQEGWVYWSPDGEHIDPNLPPLDRIEDIEWQSIVSMLSDAEYPSAKSIE